MRTLYCDLLFTVYTATHAKNGQTYICDGVLSMDEEDFYPEYAIDPSNMDDPDRVLSFEADSIRVSLRVSDMYLTIVDLETSESVGTPLNEYPSNICIQYEPLHHILMRDDPVWTDVLGYETLEEEN